MQQQKQQINTKMTINRSMPPPYPYANPQQQSPQMLSNAGMMHTSQQAMQQQQQPTMTMNSNMQVPISQQQHYHMQQASQQAGNQMNLPPQQQQQQQQMHMSPQYTTNNPQQQQRIQMMHQQPPQTPGQPSQQQQKLMPNTQNYNELMPDSMLTMETDQSPALHHSMNEGDLGDVRTFNMNFNDKGNGLDNESANDLIISDLDEVGEVMEFSFTLNFQGNGVDNLSVNELVHQSTDNQESGVNKESNSNLQTSSNDNNNNSKNDENQCLLNNTANLNGEILKQELIDQQQVESNSSSSAAQPTSTDKQLNGGPSSTNAKPDLDSVDHKQNALLKKLLQNCASADSSAENNIDQQQQLQQQPTSQTAPVPVTTAKPTNPSIVEQLLATSSSVTILPQQPTQPALVQPQQIIPTTVTANLPILTSSLTPNTPSQNTNSSMNNVIIVSSSSNTPIGFLTANDLVNTTAQMTPQKSPIQPQQLPVDITPTTISAVPSTIKTLEESLNQTPQQHQAPQHIVVSKIETPTNVLTPTMLTNTSNNLKEPPIKIETGNSIQTVPTITTKIESISPASKPLVTTVSNSDKKPSYLDIRRAQLEREKTPPLDEVKPKKKRNPVKRKESTSGGKDNANKQQTNDGTGPPPRKRSRKSSSASTKQQQQPSSEDLEQQMNAISINLNKLFPPVQISEPEVKPNNNVCPVPGNGNLNAKDTVLRGNFGKSYMVNELDYYTEQLFMLREDQIPGSGCKSLASNTKTPHQGKSNSCTSGRGFYSQEFPNGITLQQISNQIITKDYPFRYLRDSNSPESLVSGSESESETYDDNENAFDKLGIFKSTTNQQDLLNRSSSPIMPLMIPYSNIRRDQNKENNYSNGTNFRSSHLLPSRPGWGPLRETSNIPITITLNSTSNLTHMLFRLSKLLDIDQPEYIMSRSPESKTINNESQRQLDSIKMEVDEKNVSSKASFCKFCEVLIEKNEVIKKKFVDASNSKEDEEYPFCSTNCYMQFALSCDRPSENKETSSTVSHFGDASIVKPLATSTSPPSHFDNLPSTLMEDDELSNLSPKQQPTIAAATEDKKEEEEKMTVSSAIEDDDDNTLNDTSMNELSSSPIVISNKQWKGIRYKNWSEELIKSIVVKDKKPLLLATNEVDQAKLKNICIKPAQMPEDKRECVMCLKSGEGNKDCEGRLLNMDLDKWIHLNCALWSNEVYETQNGSLVNVFQAYKRAVSVICIHCQKSGASVKCFKIRCNGAYHFACAIKEKCTFYKDKTVFCTQHVPKQTNQDEQMSSFEVPRKVYVSREEHQQIAHMIQQSDQSIIRLGSLMFMNIGQLLPHQLIPFHSPNSIYPVGYKICRFYWSYRELHKRCRYFCSINDNNGKPEFVVEIEEVGYPNEVHKGKSPKQVFSKIISSIEKLREKGGKIKLFTDYVTGEDLFGLTEPSIVRILESLPGVDTLSDYNFKFNKSQLYELPLAINPSGCACTEPKLRTQFKRPHTLHTSSSLRSSLQSLSGKEIQSPYQKQFVHSKSSQYRKMKTEWRNNVYLARSSIAGLGLYAARDIEKHTMIIEYIGEIIRNEICERNERLYEQQNRRGVYMFRLDENRVIDATIKGGLARYVNHSCTPNCVAETVQIDRENRILIIANRKIHRNEELCYDYRFETEDDSHKIQCLCGTSNCRKWMN